MAYDRYDTRDAPRDERPRWSEDRVYDSDRGQGDDRGFFERAGDEVASWFGDEEAERRRREDQMRERDIHGSSGDHNRDYDRGYGRNWSRDRWTPRSADRDFGRSPRHEFRSGSDRDFGDRSYRPITGDYGRSDRESGQFVAASGYGRGQRGVGDHGRSRHDDPHYHSWRQRHMSELDRDYDDYRRENQSRFEDDFGSWRERRMQKRSLLGQIREHMEVVGNDDEHVGTADCIRGDRIILTKSDPDSGGAHHSLSCSDIDRVEGDRVILDCSADQAKKRWRDESRSRALFEREDQGEMGPRTLDRSFEGTYR
jgi:hypothetical protein